MKALKLAAPGGLDKLSIVEMEDPGSPGPGEIRVRIRASSLNFHDLGVVLGRADAADGRIPMSDGAGEIPTGMLMRRQQRLQGLIVGNRRHQQDFVRALEATGVRPVIDRTFPLVEAADAFRHEIAGGHFGKIALAI